MRLFVSRLPQLAQFARPAAALGVLSFALWHQMRPSSMIHCDVAVRQPNVVDKMTVLKPQQLQLGNERISYEEMTLGLVTGLFLGIIAGKLLLVFVMLLLSSYFLVTFLENRGIISIPWTQIIQFGKEKIDMKAMIFDKLSFKVPFVLSFLIAAYNI